MIDANTARVAFSQPVFAAHWHVDAFLDQTLGDQSTTVTQVNTNTLAFGGVSDAMASGDQWSWDTVADNADPGQSGFIA